MQRVNVKSKASLVEARDEIDFLELASMIWGGRVWVIVFCLFFSIGAVVYSISLSNLYRSEVLLVSTSSQSSSGGLGAGQLSGLASLAGVQLGGSGADSLSITLETLKSKFFLSNFIDKFELKPAILGTTGWNDMQDNWIYNEDVFDKNTGLWLSSPEPSIQRAVYVFSKKMLEVEGATKDGFVKIAITSTSPRFSKIWASNLVTEINDYLKKQAIQEAKQSISYLEKQLGETDIAQMKSIFYQLIEQQIKTIMLAQAGNNYALKVIDPAIVPEQRSSPNRAVISVVGALLGLFFGVLVAFIVGYRGKWKAL